MADIFDWPEDLCAGVETRFYLRSFSISSTQFLSRTRSVYGPVSQLWGCDITVPMRESRDWQRASAFISHASGISGLIRMWDPKRPRPWRNRKPQHTPVVTRWSDGTLWQDGTGWDEAPVGQTATVMESAERGATTLLIGGLSPLMQPAMVTGDLLEIQPDAAPATHGHLYEVWKDSNTDASGMMRVFINPGLRQGVRYGDQIVLDRPKSLFRLVDDDQGIVEHRGGQTADIGFSLVEVLP